MDTLELVRTLRGGANAATRGPAPTFSSSDTVSLIRRTREAQAYRRYVAANGGDMSDRTDDEVLRIRDEMERGGVMRPLPDEGLKLGGASDFVGGLTRGAISGPGKAIANALGGAGEIAGVPEGYMLSPGRFYEAAENIAREEEARSPTEGAAGFVGQAVGSVAPSAAALLGPGLPATIGYYAAQGFGSGVEEARDGFAAQGREPTRGELLASGLIGAGTEAGSEYIGIGALGKIGGKIAGRAGEAIASPGIRSAARLAGAVGQAAVVEGTEEALSQAGQNLGARAVGYDPTRPVLAGTGEAFLGGAIGGALLGAPAALGARYAGTQQAVEGAWAEARQQTVDGARAAAQGLQGEERIQALTEYFAEDAPPSVTESDLRRAAESMAQELDAGQPETVAPSEPITSEPAAIEPVQAEEPASGIAFGYGNEQQTQADGEEIDTRYAVVDASELPQPEVAEDAANRVDQVANNFRAEHALSEDASADTGPPVVDDSGEIVTGRTRLRGQQLGYERGGKKAETIRSATIASAPTFGIDPAKVEAVKNPVIVRVAKSESAPVAGFPAGPNRGAKTRGQTTTQRIRAPQVEKAFVDIVEAAGAVRTPVRVGRIAQRNALGIYKVRDDVIRLIRANDLPVAAHEAAHALEDAVYGWSKGGPWRGATKNPAAVRELVKLGRDLYGSTKPAGGYTREGWAEYVRIRLTEGKVAATQAAPQFTKWFEGSFLPGNPKIARAFEKAGAAHDRWVAQGARGRAEMMIAPQPSRVEAVAQAANPSRLKTRTIDALEPLNAMADAVEKITGRKLDASENPYTVAAAFRGTAPARARFFLNESAIDLWGNPVGPSLKQALAPIQPSERDDFTLYLYARRAIALHTDPQGARDPGISLEDAREVYDELHSDRFALAAGSVYEWTQRLLDYAAQSSPTYAKVVAAIRERDPGDYVPLQRAFDSLSSVARRSGGTSGGRITGRLRGSGRLVKNPLESLVAQTERIMRTSHKALVREAIFQLADQEGVGSVIEEVPVDRVPAAQRTLDQVIEELRGRGIDINATDRAGNEVDPTDIAVTFFEDARTPKGGDPILPRWDGDRVRWYQVSKDVYESMEQVTPGELSGLVNILSISARMVRLGATGLNPGFSLIFNPTRDLPGYLMKSKGSGGTLRALSLWAKSLGESFVGRTAGQVIPRYQSESVRSFRALGLEMAQPLGQDSSPVRRAKRELFERGFTRVLDPRNAYEVAIDLFQFPESAPRMAEMQMVLRDAGWKPGEKLTRDQAITAMLAAKQVTVDFTAMGEVVRAINQVVPFFNATVQGARSEVRALARNPKRYLIRGSYIAALTLWLWWRNKDEEWYKEMPDEVKYSYWHVPVEVGGQKTLIRVPRPFDFMSWFSSLPEAIANRSYSDDPSATRAYLSRVMDSLIPSFTPAFAEPGLEQMVNRDFFTGRPIVPEGQKRLPAAEQTGPYTSEFAKGVGRAFNISPRRIDHFISGTTGGLGREVVNAVGLGPERSSGVGPSTIPVAGRLFARGGQIGAMTKSIDRLYDEREKAERRHASKDNPETPDERLRRLALDDAAGAVSAIRRLANIETDPEKREELLRRSVKIAQDALKPEARGRRFQGERNLWEKRWKAASRKAS